MRVETLADLHRRNAQWHGQRPALAYRDRRMNYSELLRGADSLAQSWTARGLRKGERVAILARNLQQVQQAFVACELAGFVAVPLNHRLAVPELESISAHCEPALLLYEHAFREAATRLQTARPPRLGSCLVDGVEFASDCLAPAGDGSRGPPVAPRDAACILYTSGTTGRPKGVTLDHRALLATARSMAMETGAQMDDVLAVAMPMFHVGARCKMLGYAYRGALCVLMDRFDAPAYLDEVARVRATALHLAPTMLQALVQELDAAPRDLAHVRAIHYAAAPIAPALLERCVKRFGPVMRQFYGMTETGGGGTVLHPADHVLPQAGAAPDPRLASAGQPGEGVAIRVVGDDDSELPAGRAGEVEILCPAAMAGYWRDEEGTAKAMHDGWIRTGDIGRIDAGGYLTLLDRKKDMVVSGGENIYPREVEEALLSHPAVAEAAVIGVPDARWGESIVAFVVPVGAGASTPSEPELIGHVKHLIASYKKPRTVRFVTELPKLPTGKIDKKALRAAFHADRQEAVRGGAAA